MKRSISFPSLRGFRLLGSATSAAALSLSLSSCASLFSGVSGSQVTSDPSQVTSDPEGAKCQVGAYTVVTPGPVTVKHSASPVQVTCKKKGYEDIFLVPWIVDLATGNAWTHDDAVNVVLAKKD